MPTAQSTNPTAPRPHIVGSLLDDTKTAMTASRRLLMVVPAAELGNCIETLGQLIAEGH